MSRNCKLLRVVVFVALMCLCQTSVFSFHKKIALTFDDLPCLESYSSLDRVIQINQNIINALKKHNIQSVVFVNENKIHHRGETKPRIKILQEWIDNGHELGNHTASHQKVSEITMHEFEKEVIGGENTIGPMMHSAGKNLRFFRYPFLMMGRDVKQINQTERFLKKRGYIVASITIDSLDWKFNTS
jgi:peptidoglycan/xylan/chitin deacetylase (PgdA/CDA1 family)